MNDGLTPRSGEPFNQYSLGPATLRSTERSSVTSAWGVDWDEELIARDLMQNFFDANRKQLDKVVVAVRDRLVCVSAPATFALRRLFFLGSEKGDDDVGKYGEGFKAAAICILRRSGTSIVAASGTEGVVIRLSEEPAAGTNLFPLIYDFYDLARPVVGSVLLVDGAWRELCRAMERGLTHFFHDRNPLISKTLVDGRDFRLFRSTTDGGHIFYRNLRRGDIPDLPVVLVLDKQYARIEKEVAKDRDRKAFGDTVREIFYGIWAKHFFSSRSTQEHVVSAAEPLWKHGRGHSLLAAIARSSWRTSWQSSDAKRVFGNGFYAESPTDDPRELMKYREIEAGWIHEGRRSLPSYFSAFGVVSAHQRTRDLSEAAKAEARKKGAHRPTATENRAIGVLRNVLLDFAPKIGQFYEEKRTSYTIAATDVLLGEFKQGRGYHSHEIFLAERLFESDFAEALAVFLHEHAHIHGYDGSRTFTDALTEILETTVRERHSVDEHERSWEVARKAVVAERKKTEADRKDDALSRLEAYDRDELLAFVRAMPRTVVASALRKQRSRKKA
jgi:hypothetical protein